MQSFEFYTPTKIVFGKDTENKVADLVLEKGGSRVILVYGGQSAEKSGLLGRVRNSLQEKEIPFVDFGGAVPNPHLDHAEEGVKTALDFGADFVLAVGGGSSIDTAKGIAAGVANPDAKLWDIWTKKVAITKSTPVGVILTISAAGSEMSDSAVLTNTEIGIKKGLSTDLNRPAFAIMNPELTYSIPKYQLCAGIVDIMMHTLDRYFATPEEGNEMTDAISEGLFRTVIKNAKKAYEDQTDYEAMSELMWAGSLSHNCITELGKAHDFSVHRLGHALSAIYDMTHGATLSICFPNWAEEIYQECPYRFALYARRVWGIKEEDDLKAAKAGIDATKEFFRSLDMPTTFSESELGILSDEAIEKIALMTVSNGARPFGTAKKLDLEETLSIYHRANV